MCVPLTHTLGGQLKDKLSQKLGIEDPGMKLTKKIDEKIYGKARVNGGKVYGPAAPRPAEPQAQLRAAMQRMQIRR